MDIENPCKALAQFTCWLTCEEEKQKHENGGVPKVQKGVGEPRHLQLGDEKVDAVEEKVHSRKATGQE